MEPRHEALGERFEAALERIGAYFMASSPVQNAAVEIARRLSEMGIDYAIAGALCLAAHGVVRATEDVDVLIARDGLARFKENWLGRGYVEVRAGGKNVRDTVNGVKIDFLIEGDYPGDGKPKPVRFPSPAVAGVGSLPHRRPAAVHRAEAGIGHDRPPSPAGSGGRAPAHRRRQAAA